GQSSALASSPSARRPVRSPPTHVTSSAPAALSARATRTAIATPPTGNSALSRPIRELAPPVRMTADHAPSAAIVHARALHAEHRCVLCLLEHRVDHLADEERVVAAVDRLPHFAFDIARRLREHWGAGDPTVDVREVVERRRGLVDIDRLGELAHD